MIFDRFEQLRGQLESPSEVLDCSEGKTTRYVRTN